MHLQAAIEKPHVQLINNRDNVIEPFSECGYQTNSSLSQLQQGTTQAGESCNLSSGIKHQFSPLLDLLVQRKWFIKAKEGDIREHYDFEDQVGSGTFGRVYRVRDKRDDQLYAVKSVVKGRMNDLQIFINEINILRELVSSSININRSHSIDIIQSTTRLF